MAQAIDITSPIKSYDLSRTAFEALKLAIPDEATGKAIDSDAPLMHLKNLRKLSQACIKEIQRQRGKAVIVVNSRISNPIADSSTELLELLLEREHSNVDIILTTNGGLPNSALYIVLQCKERFQNFSVIIPRRAKSAGTLLALGASEIMMGVESELGPIDPQIVTNVKGSGKPKLIPALSLKKALELIDEKTANGRDRNALQKFLPILSSLDLVTLGEYQIIIDGVRSEAKRLLSIGGIDDENIREKILHDLLSKSQMHSKVISYENASEIGLNIFNPKNKNWDVKLWAVIRNLYFIHQNLIKFSKISNLVESATGVLEIEGVQILTQE